MLLPVCAVVLLLCQLISQIMHQGAIQVLDNPRVVDRKVLRAGIIWQVIRVMMTHSVPRARATTAISRRARSLGQHTERTDMTMIHGVLSRFSFACARSASSHAICVGSSEFRSSPTMCSSPMSVEAYRLVLEGVVPWDDMPSAACICVCVCSAA